MGVEVEVNGSRKDTGELYPIVVRVPMTLARRCAECGGVAMAVLEVRGASSGFRSGFDHASSCSEVSCPHGRLWGDDCPGCTADAAPTPREVDQ